MNDAEDTKVRGTILNYFYSLERLMKPPVQYCVCGHSIATHSAGKCSDCNCAGFANERDSEAHGSGTPPYPGQGA